jgi:hypothetical protein
LRGKERETWERESERDIKARLEREGTIEMDLREGGIEIEEERGRERKEMK